jgi:hypothetical protein
MVEDHETGIYGDLPVLVIYNRGVGVAAESRVGLEETHPWPATQQPCGYRPADAAPDYGHSSVFVH